MPRKSLQDDERGAQEADVGCPVERPGLGDEIDRPLGQEAGENRQHGETDDVQHVTRPRRRLLDQEIDANVAALDQGVTQSQVVPKASM